MTIIMLIFAAMFAVAFYFINKLINQYTDLNWKLSDKIRIMESDLDNLYDDYNYLKTELDKTNHNVDIDKKNIDACANAILNIRNNVGKLGNRLQNLERKEDNE